MDLTNFSLKKAVAGLEDGIIVLSGPALAISGIIAGVDLVTGGNILKSIWWLSLVWAITLLLTLDFQVLALGVRAHRVYVHAKKAWWQKALEVLLLCLVAAGISFVSIQMQSIIARVNAESVSIDLAASQLGINMIALIWERSTLVLVLIFMSGWLREHEEPKQEEVAPAPAMPVIDMQAVITELDQRNRASMEVLYQKTVETVGIIIAEQTNPRLPAITRAPARDELAEHAQSLAGSQFTSKEQDVARVLAQNSEATVEEVARLAGCNLRTAEKWMKRLEVPHKADDTNV